MWLFWFQNDVSTHVDLRRSEFHLKKKVREFGLNGIKMWEENIKIKDKLLAGFLLVPTCLLLLKLLAALPSCCYSLFLDWGCSCIRQKKPIYLNNLTQFIGFTNLYSYDEASGLSNVFYLILFTLEVAAIHNSPFWALFSLEGILHIKKEIKYNTPRFLDSAMEVIFPFCDKVYMGCHYQFWL